MCDSSHLVSSSVMLIGYLFLILCFSDLGGPDFLVNDGMNNFYEKLKIRFFGGDMGNIFHGTRRSSFLIQGCLMCSSFTGPGR